MTTLQVRRSLAIVIAASLLSSGVSAQGTPSRPATEGRRFEAASIKRNTVGNVPTGPPALPNGEITLVNAPARILVLRAYPVDAVPVDIVGAPSWLDSERYDLRTRSEPGTTPEQQQEMMRALLADRMKLAAHYETREKPTYDLVLARANGALGAGLQRSALDCTQPQAPARPPAGASMREFGLSRCKSFGIERDETMYSGGVAMTDLARMISSTAGRPVFDRTGLSGFFSVALRYQRFPPRADVPPSADDPPSLFTALQEQLGLKLESGRAQVPVLVIDHIERPDPD